MNIKEKVLGMLIENGEMSGEAMAESLGVSRNTVWKAINALRQDGYEINAATNRGYFLAGDGDVLSKAAVDRYLAELGCTFWDTHVDAEVTSTNNVAKELAEAGAREGTVVLASCQTQGRGRMGRSFYSPKNTGLYMTMLLRPKISAKSALFMTTLAAVCVADAVEEVTGKATGIKWVNDVLCGDKKICGILTEASLDMESGGFQYAVCGIGVNVTEPEGGFPEEIRDVAGSLYANERPAPHTRSRIAAHILAGFAAGYAEIEKKAFMPEYKRRSVLIGSRVTMYVGKDTFEGVAIDIDDDAGLVVKLDSGEKRAFSSGEARARRKNEKQQS